MSRKAPSSLALLLGVGWLFAQTANATVVAAIDTPTQNQTVFGVVRVSGFALDFTPISKIEILVDGVIVNQADLNIPRADVLLAFPTYLNSATPDPGFISSFLARNYVDGLHSLTVKITESTGAVTFVGPVSVIVDNSQNQAPFGYIDIPGATGVEVASGAYPIVGWALDDQDVDHLDFLVDGTIVAGAVGRGLPGTAEFGSPRPDVYAAFPDFPGPAPKSLYSGFIANIDTTQFLDGMHVVSVRATDNQGLSAEIGSRTIEIENVGLNLAPFGWIDFPLDKASLQCSGTFAAPPVGTCPSPCTFPPTQNQPELFPNLVNGWALDTGARLDKGQVAYVELLIDGTIIANTRLDCVFVNGMPNNCYGVNRPDVARLFPGYVNADNSGFSFLFFLTPNADTGLLNVNIAGPTGDVTVGPGFFISQIAPGKHTLAVRVGDDHDTVVQIGAMSVDVVCDASSTDRPAIGYIDSPAVYEFINGIFPVFGWAFDPDGIHTTNGVQDGIELDIDGQVIATSRSGSCLPTDLCYGLDRPDVPAADPRVTTPFVGFGYLLDTTKLTDGQHEMVIYVLDALSVRSEIGRRKFVVLNNVSTRQ